MKKDIWSEFGPAEFSLPGVAVRWLCVQPGVNPLPIWKNKKQTVQAHALDNKHNHTFMATYWRIFSKK